MSRKGRHLFTSESVTEGHPDKIADQISDAILDAILTQDPVSRVACETLVTTGLAVVAGEITTSAYVDFQEVVRATIRNNQKCFVVSDIKTGKLTNKFILTANIEASDGGKAIVAGNERVIRARLSDAKFFYESDLKTRLQDRLPKFDNIVFHEKLGTQGERIERIERLAAEIAPLVGADVEKTKRAARLANASGGVAGRVGEGGLSRRREAGEAPAPAFNCPPAPPRRRRPA